MNRFQFRITLRVLAIHVVVILFLLLQSCMQGCFHPEPRPEIVTFIEFGQPAPPPQIVEVEEVAEPEPPQDEPAPESDPIIPNPVVPSPVKRLDPVKPTPPKKVVKPTPTYTKPEDIKIGKKVSNTPVPPRISQSDIKNALKDVVDDSAPVGTPDEINAYISKVGNYFYPKWIPPASASPGSASCVIRVSFNKSGSITGRKKIQSSGDSLYDQSAMDAVKSVSTVPRPPTTYPYDYVNVSFRIRN